MFIIALAVLSIIGKGYAYSTGAPDVACQTMTPQHRNNIGQLFQAQTRQAPYMLTVPSSYTPGSSITLTLGATQAFIGYMVQARQVGTGQPIGTWRMENAEIQKVTNCNGSPNTITHPNKNPKNNINLVWNAPASAGNGNIEFWYSVVSAYNTFWVQIRSQPLTEVQNTTPGLVTGLVTGVVTTQMSTSMPNMTSPAVTVTQPGARGTTPSKGANHVTSYLPLFIGLIAMLLCRNW